MLPALLYTPTVVLLLLLSFLTIAPPALADKRLCPTASRDQLQQEHQQLLEQIDKHNNLYRQGIPAISDMDYDALVARQRLIERCLGLTTPKKSSSFIYPDQKHHRYPLGSLKKADGTEDVENFLGYALRLGTPVIVQPKIDGMAIELVYQKGRLVQALTRGSQSGSSQQSNAIDLMPFTTDIPAIPQTLPTTHREIVLHGELYARNDNPFAEEASSPRHYSAGLIHQNAPATEELALLQFFPWHWVKSPLGGIHANIRQLVDWGFTAVQQHTHPVKSLREVARLRSDYQHQHHREQMPLDGIVIKMEKTTIQNRLGYLDGTPYWALGWKFPATSAATTVSGIDWSIGRTGQITAVLELEPVPLSGLTVSRVNIGPISHFIKLDIARDDTVIVALKGGATPVFKQVIHRPDNRRPTPLPDQRRFNPLTCLQPQDGCHEQFMARLLWLIGKHGLELPAITAPELEELVDSKKIQQLHHLFTLTNAELSQQTIDVLRNHNLPLEQAIRALGIPEVGRKRSRLLAERAGNWQAIQNASAVQIEEWLNSSMGEAITIKHFLEKPEVQAVSHYLIRSETNRQKKEP